MASPVARTQHPGNERAAGIDPDRCIVVRADRHAPSARRRARTEPLRRDRPAAARRHGRPHPPRRRWQRSATSREGPVGVALGEVAAATRRGASLTDELAAMEDRLGPAVRPLASTLVLAATSGAPLAPALARLGDHERRRLRRRAEARVRQTPGPAARTAGRARPPCVRRADHRARRGEHRRHGGRPRPPPAAPIGDRRHHRSEHTMTSTTTDRTTRSSPPATPIGPASSIGPSSLTRPAVRHRGAAPWCRSRTAALRRAAGSPPGSSPGSPPQRRHRRRSRSRERAQSTVEYALILLGAAAIALVVVAWVTRSDAIGRLFDTVLARVLQQAG